MGERTPRAVDEVVRALLKAGRLEAAVERVLAAYGSEVAGYIMSLTRDAALAEEAFQVFSIRLWRGLEGFRWQSALRTWAYTVARHAALRALEDPYKRRAQVFATGELEQLPARWARTATAEWRRTDEKQRLWALIEGFAPEERELLVLRLGRQMSWLEIAAVFAPPAADSGGDGAADQGVSSDGAAAQGILSDGVTAGEPTTPRAAVDAASLRRQAATLRKRFERLKERLRQLHGGACGEEP